MEKDDVISYRASRAQNREAWHRTILDVAGRILATDGPAALTMRRVAQEVDASTTVLYSLFGGKEGLVNELYLEGFTRLQRALEGVPRGDDPLEYVRALGWRYRENALAHPTYYGVMFERVVPGFVPPVESVGRVRDTFAVLVGAVQESMDAGLLREGDPAAIANMLWGLCHGLVSLERAGHAADPEEAHRLYGLAMETAFVGLLRRPGEGT